MLIFIAESDQNLRLGLQMLLHQEDGIHIIGLAAKADGLFTQVKASQANVLLLDWYLSGTPMTEFLSQLRGVESPPKVIVFSVNPEDKKVVIAAGADAFISKNAPPAELLDVVRSMKRQR